MYGMSAARSKQPTERQKEMVRKLYFTDGWARTRIAARTGLTNGQVGYIVKTTTVKPSCGADLSGLARFKSVVIPWKV